jgi:hypothetical protein
MLLCIYQYYKCHIIKLNIFHNYVIYIILILVSIIIELNINNKNIIKDILKIKYLIIQFINYLTFKKNIILLTH